MPQYVVKVQRSDATPSSDLLDMVADYRAQTNATGAAVELRGTDSAESSAVADTLASLRDALGHTDPVTYHVCQHTEGVGSCTAEVR
jgi:hypothetical protein